MDAPRLLVETFAVQPLGCNCSIVGDPVTRRAIVVDPGGEHERILARLRELGLSCSAILHTHTHFDHVGASAQVQRAHDARAYVHEKDLFLYRMLAVQCALFGMRAPARAEVEPLADGAAVTAGGVTLGALHTPGHSPGSLSFVLERGDSPIVFAGDTLFARSIGRTDLWGGDPSAIVKSIRGKLFTLPDETVVVTGHGPATTIGDEKRFNPFVRTR